jgi:hypothetical protein
VKNSNANKNKQLISPSVWPKMPCGELCTLPSTFFENHFQFDLFATARKGDRRMANHGIRRNSTADPLLNR